MGTSNVPERRSQTSGRSPFAVVHSTITYALPFREIALRIAGLRVHGDDTRNPYTNFSTLALLFGRPQTCRVHTESRVAIHEDFTGGLTFETIEEDQHVGFTDIMMVDIMTRVHGETLTLRPTRVQPRFRWLTTWLEAGGYFGRMTFGAYLGALIGSMTAASTVCAWVMWHLRPFSHGTVPQIESVTSAVGRMIATNPRGRLVTAFGAFFSSLVAGGAGGALVGAGLGYQQVFPPGGELEHDIEFRENGPPIIHRVRFTGTCWPDARVQVVVITATAVVFFVGIVRTTVPESSFDDPFAWNSTLSRGREPREFDECTYGVITNPDVIRRIIGGEPVIRLLQTDYEQTPNRPALEYTPTRR